MKDIEYVLITALSLVAVLAVLYLHIRKLSRKIRVNLNSEYGVNKLIELLFVFDQKRVFLNITLTDVIAEEFKKYSTLTLPLVYRSRNLTGGIKVIFDIKKDYKIFDKIFTEPNRIKGYFKIIHQPGTELGWFTISMLPT